MLAHICSEWVVTLRFPAFSFLQRSVQVAAVTAAAAVLQRRMQMLSCAMCQSQTRSESCHYSAAQLNTNSMCHTTERADDVTLQSEISCCRPKSVIKPSSLTRGSAASLPVSAAVPTSIVSASFILIIIPAAPPPAPPDWHVLRLRQRPPTLPTHPAAAAEVTCPMMRFPWRRDVSSDNACLNCAGPQLRGRKGRGESGRRVVKWKTWRECLYRRWLMDKNVNEKRETKLEWNDS